MQLGMIGLGRMGANMVRRLMKNGHQCVVFDMSPKAVEELAAEKATGVVVARRFRGQARQAARGVADGAGGGGGQDDRGDPAAARARRHPHRRRQFVLRRRHPARQGTRAEGHPLRRRRHQRRRVGPRARLLHDDRRRDGHREASRSDLRDARARHRQHRPHARTRKGERHVGARLSALRAERRRPFRQDGSQRHRIRPHGRLRRGPEHPARRQCRQAARTKSTRRRRRCATPSITSTT